jgi:hypothetical protein
LLPERLTSIDETNREHHAFLEPDDRCFFFGEYFAYKGYQGGGTNQLIFNFKCKPSVAATNPGRRRYKEQAIESVAAGLRRAMTQADAESMTWVPVPPSKVAGHADYDDRLMRTLTKAFSGYHVDVRSLLRQSMSTEADHNSGSRLTPDALHALMELDIAQLNALPVGQAIVLFDDVLTTGKHFKCCERRLREVVPANVPILGVFIARRILPDATVEFEDIT